MLSLKHYKQQHKGYAMKLKLKITPKQFDTLLLKNKMENVRDLAKLSGASRETIYLILRGRNTNPATANRIAQSLSKDTDKLFKVV